MVKAKKPKSVERVKIVKRANPTKPEISQRNNDNANANIVQVIFPADTELRKVRKKRKGKSSAMRKRDKEKDELLETLKQKLNEYDQLQVQAQKANIKIPAEVGISIINKSDLKTNQDIQNYINDVTGKIGLLQRLIEEAQTPAQVGLPLRLGSGVAPILPSLPALPQPFRQPIPIPIPAQPQPQQPIPIQPKPQPTPQPEPDQTKEALDKIAKDIQDKLKEEGTDVPPSNATQPVQPVQPDQPDQPDQPVQPVQPESGKPSAEFIEELKAENLIDYRGTPVGNGVMDIIAPRGWGTLYEQFRQYQLGVIDQVTKNEIIEGVFHIPLADENRLYTARNQLRDQYKEWFNALPNNQKNFIMNPKNQPINDVHIQILLDVDLRPEEFAKKLMKEQNIKFTEITAGNQVPAIESRIKQGGLNPFKKEEDNRAYKKYNDQYFSVSTSLQELMADIKALIRSPPGTSRELKQTRSKINAEINELDTRLIKQYNDSPDPVKVAVLTENDKLSNRINQARVALGEVGRDSGSAAQPLRPRIAGKAEAIKTLKIYVNASRPNTTDKIRQSIELLFGEQFLDMVKKGKAQEKRQLIFDKFLAFMKDEDPSWNPRNKADRNPGNIGGEAPEGSRFFGTEPSTFFRDKDVRIIQKYLEESYQGTVFKAIPVSPEVKISLERLFGTAFIETLDNAGDNLGRKYSIIYNRASTYREEGAQFILENLGTNKTSMFINQGDSDVGFVF